jgi:hypothetical protein
MPFHVSDQKTNICLTPYTSQLVVYVMKCLIAYRLLCSRFSNEW